MLNFFRKEVDPYSLQHESLYIEEEPIYVPRSVMADIIYKVKYIQENDMSVISCVIYKN